MISVLTVVFSLLSLTIVGLILVQRGSGADMGGGLGGGASQTMFGSSGSASFLTRATAVLATLFFVLCLTLAFLARQPEKNHDITQLADPSAANMVKEDPKPVGPADIPAVPE